MDIVYQNAQAIVVDKPHGWLTTPSRDAADPRPCLGRKLQSRIGSQIFPVHRLDFEVSGLVLFALDKDSHRTAQAWFEDGLVGKTYQALSKANGQPLTEWQEWRSQIVRGKRRSFSAPHGKVAVTHARVVRELDGHWLWELMPLTGRPHQLRFEMAQQGCPIVGDTLYGGESHSAPNQIFLRAIRLDFKDCGEARLGLPVVIETEPLQIL